MTQYRITDYHRGLVAGYYGRLFQRYGIDNVLRHIKKIRMIVWTQEGLKIMEGHNATN